jgi:ABC-type hemin transport system substrate-binding protein
VIDVVDDLGRRVTLDRPAQRIVCLVPSLTETLFALGSGARLVGVTRYCVEPAGCVGQLPRVGGTKNPDIERIRRLRPDMVIMNAEENRKQDYAALEEAGLARFVSFPHTPGDVVGLLRRLGVLTGSAAQAARYARELRHALSEVGAGERVAVRRVFCPIWKNPWMSFNHDTYADAMLTLAGGLNVCRDRAMRYCQVTLEEIAALTPEVILLPSEPYVFTAKDLPALAALSQTPAGRQRRVQFIDGKALSWYGTRTASALPYLQAMLARPGPADAPPAPQRRRGYAGRA